MSGPWEEYGSAAPAQAGPWAEYSTPPAAPEPVPVPAAGTRPAVKTRAQLPKLADPQTRTDRFIQGLREPIDGGAQLLTNMLPDAVVDAGNRANNWLADKTGLVPRISAKGINESIRAQQAEYEAQRAASGHTGFDGYRLLGNIVNPVTLATGAGGTGASIAGRVGLGVARGAASASLAPVTQGEDFWKEKAKQVATGAAVGGAAAPLVGAVARVISPNASRNANLALLRKEGVSPTVGQALGGAANRIEERFQSVPIVGDAISAARGRANTQFQAASVNRSLKPIGEKLPGGVSGRDAVTYAENALKENYDAVLERIGAIPADRAFGEKVGSLQSMVNRDVLSKAAKQKFQMVINDVKSAFDNGVLTSEGYKRVESSLGADVRKLTSSQDIYDGRLAPAVKQLQNELRELLSRQAGQGANDLRAANAGWANFKRVQNAASKIGAEGGEFTPAQYQNAVRALDKSKDKGAFARGNALGQDLGDAGKSVLGSKVPNSGTADRMFNAGLIGSALVNPAIPLGALAAAGFYTTPAQRLLLAAASSRPGAAKPAADALRKATPMLIPGLAQFSLGNSK